MIPILIHTQINRSKAPGTTEAATTKKKPDRKKTTEEKPVKKTRKPKR